MADATAQFKKRAKARAEMGEGAEDSPSFASKTDILVRGAAGFKFFELPLEIREFVYEYAVGTNTMLFLDKTILPPLTRVCRKMRKETIPLFCKNNTFNITVNVRQNRDLRSWDLLFGVRGKNLMWLAETGYDTPVFTSVKIHFGTQNRTGILIRCERDGLRLTHESECRFCYADTQGLTPLPAALRSQAPYDNPILSRLIALNEARVNDLMENHEHLINDLKEYVIGRGRGKLDPDLKALSVRDLHKIQGCINESIAVLSLGIHGIDSARVKESPLKINVEGKSYTLQNDE